MAQLHETNGWLIDSEVNFSHELGLRLSVDDRQLEAARLVLASSLVDLEESELPDSDKALQTSRIIRDDGATIARQAQLATGTSEMSELFETSIARVQTAKVMADKLQVLNGNKMARSKALYSEQGANYSLVRRIELAKLVAAAELPEHAGSQPSSDCPELDISKQPLAQPRLRLGSNTYYLASDAMHEARRAKLFGERKAMYRNLGVAAVALTQADGKVATIGNVASATGAELITATARRQINPGDSLKNVAKALIKTEFGQSLATVMRIALSMRSKQAMAASIRARL